MPQQLVVAQAVDDLSLCFACGARHLEGELVASPRYPLPFTGAVDDQQFEFRVTLDQFDAPYRAMPLTWLALVFVGALG